MLRGTTVKWMNPRGLSYCKPTFISSARRDFVLSVTNNGLYLVPSLQLPIDFLVQDNNKV